jgi:hypothetical protein
MAGAAMIIIESLTASRCDDPAAVPGPGRRVTGQCGGGRPGPGVARPDSDAAQSQAAQAGRATQRGTGVTVTRTRRAGGTYQA